MKKNSSIKLKAAFLLMVFSLNTMVGFACSLGVDMGFNSKHHENDGDEPVVHVHADGKRHVHEQKGESERHDKSHHHEQPINKEKSGNEKDNCCSDKMTKFERLDKFVPETLSIINPVFFVALVSTFSNMDVLFTSQLAPNIKQFVRSYHPPIPDIRLAIQSFQI